VCGICQEESETGFVHLVSNGEKAEFVTAMNRRKDRVPILKIEQGRQPVAVD
jgi:hypothetical protein